MTGGGNLGGHFHLSNGRRVVFTAIRCGFLSRRAGELIVAAVLILLIAAAAAVSGLARRRPASAPARAAAVSESATR